MKKKYVFYTAIIGDYDRSPTNPAIANQNEFDFICFSDTLTSCNEPWQIVKIDRRFTCPYKSNRHIKFCVDEYLDGYKVVVYLDGNVLLQHDASYIVRTLDQNTMATFVEHPNRKTVLSEIIACIIYKDLNIMEAIKHFYDISFFGFNDRMPLTANRFFARKINDETNQFFRNVFLSYADGPQRDQLHLQYQLFLHNIEHKIIEKYSTDNLFKINDHLKVDSKLRRKMKLFNKALIWIPLYIILRSIATIAQIKRWRFQV